MTRDCGHEGAHFGCDVCVAAVRERFREFPLQTDRRATPGPVRVPWAVAERAWTDFARRYGSGQSVERIAERGGFGWSEMDRYFPGWRDATDAWRQLERENVELRAKVAELERERAAREPSPEDYRRAHEDLPLELVFGGDAP